MKLNNQIYVDVKKDLFLGEETSYERCHMSFEKPFPGLITYYPARIVCSCTVLYCTVEILVFLF